MKYCTWLAVKLCESILLNAFNGWPSVRMKTEVERIMLLPAKQVHAEKNHAYMKGNKDMSYVEQS